ncbi:Clp protease ClpP [Vibrio alginolyticus]|uniref:Clp protease ClpP n=1 Tax=Vibrio alginolyticus TaxID=663 RepID=UPI0035C7854C
MFKSKIAVALSNALQRPDKPQDYYKLRNYAGRNVIDLFGFIGWWDDEAIWLKNYLRDHEGEDIEIHLSSEGGDVFTGQSMYNALKAHKGKTTCYIEKAFSIASHIAMACDERKIVKGSQMMIHAVTGWCGGTEKDHQAYADLIVNSKDAIADSYVDVTGHDKEYWLDIMSTTSGRYFTSQECIELGLADEIIEPSDMTNHAPVEPDDEPEQPDGSKGEPEADEPEQPSDDTTPQPSETPPENNTNPDEDQEVNEELQRQSSIRNLFNSLHTKLGLPLTLLNSALDDQTVDLQKASKMFAEYNGEQEPEEKNPVNFGGSHRVGGSDAKEMAVNVLLNRAGVADIEPDYRSMQGASLENIVRSFQGMQSHGFGDGLYNAMLENDDIVTALGTALDKVVTSEVTSSNNKSLALKFCKEVRKNKIEKYEVHNWNEVDGFGERAGKTETGAFPDVAFGSNSKREGEIVERGSRITVTRKAFINDEWGRITALSTEHVKSAYRFADNLFVQRLMALAQQHVTVNADPKALMQLLSLELRTAVTSNGDDLGYTGGRLLAQPASTDIFKPICKTPTIEVDVINPAFGAFNEFFDVNRLNDLVVGFADGETPMELAVLTGKERPHLVQNNAIDRAQGIGWTLIWDFDIQVSNPKAIALGSLKALTAEQAE